MTTAFDEMLRTSERTMFNRCRWQHAMSYTHHLKPKVEAPALRFGTLIHAALEVYYTPRPKAAKRKTMPLADLFVKFYEAELEAREEEWPQWRDDDGDWHKYLDLGVAMCEGYVRKWAENDKEYITLSTEQTFQTPVLIPSGEDPLPHESPTIYVGTFDAILYHKPTRRLLLRDYKTTKNDPKKVGYLALDEQAGAYWAFAPSWLAHEAPEALRAKIARRLRLLPPRARKAVLDDNGQLRFDGILYDFLYKALPDERPLNAQGQSLNKDGSVSKMQPVERFHRHTVYRDAGDRVSVMQRIYEDALEIGQVRAGTMRLKKSPDRFHCQMCAYTDVCEVHETGGDWQIMADNLLTTWDPYSAHEIQEEAHGQ